MRTTTLARGAALIVGLEGVGLLVLAAWQFFALAQGDTAEAATAVALIVLTVAFAAVVIAFAGALLRDASWGRSGGIVAQLLILAVALGAATGSYAHPLIALAIALPAVVGLVPLVALVRRSAPPRDPRSDAQ